ncbi:MAG: hypothetical protein V4736_14910, partial [Bdellovibrionota bacterium]
VAGTGAADPKLVTKVQELEERLQEYEIISEDIADLSKYRIENFQLKEEIQKLRGGGPIEPSVQVEAEAAPEINTEIAIEEPVIAEEPEISAEEVMDEAAALNIVDLNAEAVIEEAPVTPPPPPPEHLPIDDDLMKEFAAAVEEQKIASGEPTEKKVIDAEEHLEDSAALVNQFEKFVNKS